MKKDKSKHEIDPAIIQDLIRDYGDDRAKWKEELNALGHRRVELKFNMQTLSGQKERWEVLLIYKLEDVAIVRRPQ